MGIENYNASIAAAQKSDMISSQKHDILKLTTSTTTTLKKIQQTTQKHRETEKHLVLKVNATLYNSPPFVLNVCCKLILKY